MSRLLAFAAHPGFLRHRVERQQIAMRVTAKAVKGYPVRFIAHLTKLVPNQVDVKVSPFDPVLWQIIAFPISLF